MKLEPGEVTCDQCKGTGKPNNNEIDYKQQYVTYPWVCDKCNGSGKLDWIEAVVGKRKTLSGNFTIKWEHSELELEEKYRSEYDQKCVEEMSRNLAKKIDRQIIKDFSYGGSETWRSYM